MCSSSMPVSQDATTFPTFSIKINDVSDEKPTLPSEEQDIDREHNRLLQFGDTAPSRARRITVDQVSNG